MKNILVNSIDTHDEEVFKCLFVFTALGTVVPLINDSIMIDVAMRKIVIMTVMNDPNTKLYSKIV